MDENKRLEINKKYITDTFLDEVKACLKGDHMNSIPFPHFFLTDFLCYNNLTGDFLSHLRDELAALKWRLTSTDLYDVYQTSDLNSVKSDSTSHPFIHALYQFFEADVRQWLERASGVKLKRMSLNGSKYCHTNTLLPHDDQLEGRAFAFIYYLTPEWRPEFGGRLHLYAIDGSTNDKVSQGTANDPPNSSPDINSNSVSYDNSGIEKVKSLLFDMNQSANGQAEIVKKGVVKQFASEEGVLSRRNSLQFAPIKSILPAENAFLFFRVGANSWHSVEEVLEANRERLSINGWFYADDVALAPLPDVEPTPPRVCPYPDYSESEQRFWLNKTYLSAVNIAKIQQNFTQQMEILLTNFLKPDIYAAISSELCAMKSDFQRVGPPENRIVFQLPRDFAPANGTQLARLLRFLCSESFFALLSQWTSVGLSRYVEMESDNEAVVDAPAPKRKKLREADSAYGVHADEEEESGSSTRNNCVDEYNADDENESYEVQFEWSLSRFSHGCYTLVDDRVIERAQRDGHSVEALLFLGTNEWCDDYGGEVHFFENRDNDDSTLRIQPAANTLAIVFRRPNMNSFTKYVNCRAGESQFHVFHASIFPSNENGDENNGTVDEDRN